MELERKFAVIRSGDVPVSIMAVTTPESEPKKWEAAYLGRSFIQQHMYAAILARRDEPSLRAYGMVIADPFRIAVDIPLVEPTPNETLLQKAYQTTFFGDIDQEKYHAFATDGSNID
jgi:hypothetical protein